MVSPFDSSSIGWNLEAFSSCEGRAEGGVVGMQEEIKGSVETGVASLSYIGDSMIAEAAVVY